MTFTAIKYGITKLDEDWVFVGGDKSVKLPIALLFFLIRSGEKNILVDVGCDVMGGFVTPEFVKPVEALKAVELEPEDITDIFITHAHSDHIDSVVHFKNARIYIQEDEAKNAAHLLPTDGRVVTFADGYTLTLPDGELRARKIGGHSIGSSVVYLTSGENKYVLVGDEFYSPRCISENRRAGFPVNPEANLAFLSELRGGEYVPIVFHDPDIVDTVPGAKRIF